MNIAFVDMSFHIQNTKSSLFFIDILKPLGTVHHISNIDAWRVVPKLKPDVVIIWQLLPAPDEIDFWRCKNIVMIPMYDACPHDIEFWNQYKKYKIFCFTQTLFEALDKAGFNCFYSQYYIDPASYKTPSFITKKAKAFFWERYQKLGWSLISKVCKALPIKHLHYHTGLTQNCQSCPSQEDIKKYSITFTEWFNDKSDMDKILDATDIYIAPRQSEGIGLSFIEALARGNLVVAYDAPTMNEYITDGVDGILFTEDSVLKNYSLTKLAAMQKKSYEKAKKGYKAWASNLDDIRTFIKSPINDYIPEKTLRGFYIWFVHFTKHVIKKIIFYDKICLFTKNM